MGFEDYETIDKLFEEIEKYKIGKGSKKKIEDALNKYVSVMSDMRERDSKDKIYNNYVSSNDSEQGFGRH